jgi:ribosomal protein S18 acetylase RimI-like enzyme
MRTMQEEDKSFLRELSKSCYHEVITDFFGDWNEDIFEAGFEKQWALKEFQIVENNNRKIGALWVVCNSDHMFIQEIQIHPSWQNQGIGTELIKKVFKEAADKKLAVRLNVFKNSKAKILYERLGFKKIDESDTHYIMQNSSP